MPARGALPNIFGITQVALDPASGIATSGDSLIIHFAGVASSSLTPRESDYTVTGGDIQLSLINPHLIGATVITPWEFSAEVAPPAAGQYDFYVRSVTGTAEPNIGPIVSPWVILAEGFTVLDAEMPGDFNGDRQVDFHDYDMWKAAFSAGAMSTADYTKWRDHLAAAFAPGRSPPATHVPEPDALLLLIAGLLTVSGRHNERRVISVR